MIESDDEILEKVMEALESIRPFLLNDDGDIELVKIEENKVYVRLLGNCSNCPINSSTIKLGVEHTIKQHAHSITEVINVVESE